MPETANRTYATGKRKTAVARVWLSPGAGSMTINGLPAEDYFERESSRMIARQSLELLELNDNYDVKATVAGGGKSAQALEDVERRRPLKRAGFLTRDARAKERKKYGQPGARKHFQYSKR
jgi:small subunit ribosomal protein S9